MRVLKISQLRIGEVAWCGRLPYCDDMNIGQLDAAIWAGAVGTILLLAWLLLGHRRQVGSPAAVFPPFAPCLAGFVIGNTPITALAPAGIVGAIRSYRERFRRRLPMVAVIHTRHSAHIGWKQRLDPGPLRIGKPKEIRHFTASSSRH